MNKLKKDLNKITAEFDDNRLAAVNSIEQMIDIIKNPNNEVLTIAWNTKDLLKKLEEALKIVYNS